MDTPEAAKAAAALAGVGPVGVLSSSAKEAENQ